MSVDWLQPIGGFACYNFLVITFQKSPPQPPFLRLSLSNVTNAPQGSGNAPQRGLEVGGMGAVEAGVEPAKRYF